MKKLQLILGAVGVLGAVGYFVGRHRLDTKDFEKKLRAWAEDKVSPVDDVDCPDVKMKKGLKFTCQVTFTDDAKRYPVGVEQTDADGMMEFQFVPPIVGAPRLEHMIIDGVKTQTGKDAKVQCGKGILEIPAAGLRCDVSVADGHGHVLVKVDADKEQISWSAVP